jgi:hypothetical protein
VVRCLQVFFVITEKLTNSIVEVLSQWHPSTSTLRVTPSAVAAPVRVSRTSRNGPYHVGFSSHSLEENLSHLRCKNVRLQQKVMKLERTVQKRDVQLRILQDLAGELQRELVSRRATTTPTRETILSRAD